MGELCRILDKGNSKFIDQLKKRWEDFCTKVQFYAVWKKVMKPPMTLDGGKLFYLVHRVKLIEYLKMDRLIHYLLLYFNIYLE